MTHARFRPEVTVVAGSQSVVLTGRAAVIVALVVKHANLINTTEVGQAVVHFGGNKTHLDLRRGLPPIRCDF
jgi:hypothetical protein